MELLKMEKVRDSRYLKNYELTYKNKAGKEKVFEIVSHRDLKDPSMLGSSVSGLSIIAHKGDEMLLLREFRMGVNRYIYNLCAGMMAKGESAEECIRRELYEETGLSLKKLETILPPAFPAVAISDIANRVAFAEVEGEISDEHTSANEDIHAAFYSVPQLKKMLETETFSSRCQVAVYYFVKEHGGF
ncbi:MAG: NUDIX hydrolase [Lachnospiraceae bacterium]|nr:NUDIX hydrolase [Lachnospiraceae bacterium]